jgi:hypothetical protein
LLSLLRLPLAFSFTDIVPYSTPRARTGVLECIPPAVVAVAALPEIDALIIEGKFIITFADPLNETVGPLFVPSLSAI